MKRLRARLGHRRSGRRPDPAGAQGNLLTFSAYQALLPQSGYGIVPLFNSGSPFLRDQAAIFYSVLDLVEGADPMSPRRASPPPPSTPSWDASPSSFWPSAPAAASPLAAGQQDTHALECVSCWGVLPSMAVLGLVAAFPDIAGLWRAAATSAGSRRCIAGPPWPSSSRPL
jgi:hypothetical protein